MGSRKKFLLLALAVLVSLIAVPVSAAATPVGNVVYTRILYSSGAPCAPSACTFVSRDNSTGATWQVPTGSDILYTITNGNWMQYGVGFSCCSTTWRANAYTGHWIPQGHQIEFWAKQPCPSGGFHFSQHKAWTLSSVYLNYPWNLGSLTLGSGCQVAAADTLGKSLNYVEGGGGYRYAFPQPVNTATYRNLLLHHCVPLSSDLRKWACPEAPPYVYAV